MFYTTAVSYNTYRVITSKSTELVLEGTCSLMKKKLLFCLGWLMVILGAIGIVLPVLPTTPFLLLAAACFSGSSEKAYRFLIKSPLFGPFIEHYRTGKGVRLGRKIQAIVTLWCFLALSGYALQRTWAYVAFPFIGLAVTYHLIQIKTANATEEKSKTQETLYHERSNEEG